MPAIAENVWSPNPAALSADSPDEDQHHSLDRYADLAPSSHHTQPWLLAAGRHTLALYPDRARRLPVVGPDDLERTMSCGPRSYSCAQTH